MIDSFLGRLAQAGTFRVIYQAAVSLLALATVGSWWGYGTPSLTDSDAYDARLAAIHGSPLAVMYRGLNFLGIPHEWVSKVGAYLAANPPREAALSNLAVVLGLLVTFTLSQGYKFPSMPASTWWLCVAVTAQCRGPQLLLVLWLAAWLVGRSLRYRDAGELGVGITQLAVAALAAPLLLMPLMIDSENP